MSISDIGWCPLCRANILDHPALRCPWCNGAPPDLALRELAIPEGLSAAEEVRLISEHIDSMMVRLNSARSARAVAARRLLAEEDLVEQAKLAGARVRTIEKWAAAVDPIKCSQGHARAQFGKWNGQRWICEECRRLRPAPKGRSPRPKAQAKLKQAWKDHDKRMAKRAELAAAGLLPGRLNPPMAPPASPRSPRSGGGSQ